MLVWIFYFILIFTFCTFIFHWPNKPFTIRVIQLARWRYICSAHGSARSPIVSRSDKPTSIFIFLLNVRRRPKSLPPHPLKLFNPLPISQPHSRSDQRPLSNNNIIPNNHIMRDDTPLENAMSADGDVVEDVGVVDGGGGADVAGTAEGGVVEGRVGGEGGVGADQGGADGLGRAVWPVKEVIGAELHCSDGACLPSEPHTLGCDVYCAASQFIVILSQDLGIWYQRERPSPQYISPTNRMDWDQRDVRSKRKASYTYEMSAKVLVSLTRSTYFPFPIPLTTPLPKISSKLSPSSPLSPIFTTPIFFPNNSLPNTPATKCLLISCQSKFSVNNAGTSASQTSMPRSR